MLLDSNIFIYAVLPKYEKLRRWCLQQSISASNITRLEVLGYHRLTVQDRVDLVRLFDLAKIYPVSVAVIERAIQLRQLKSMTLGDAIIAATALEYQQVLVTHNVKDFDWIDGLEVFDPLASD